jgi:Cd2+/Zn2+-exporting ATPase
VDVVRSVAGLVTAWVLLAVAGVAMAGVGPALPAATATAAVAGVYALLGTPELVHVLYELARGQINIHALTTVAVFGTSLQTPPDSHA